MSIELLFETHSTTEDNERGSATGWGAGALSAAGREQARQMGLRHRNDGIDAIFTSDLARAVETVQIAFPESGVPILMDWRLRECDFGDMTGIAPELLDRDAHIDVPYPSGESWRQAADRVAWFLRDIERRWQRSRLLVVGHTATWRGLEHAINETPLNAPFEWQPGWEYRLE